MAEHFVLIATEKIVKEINNMQILPNSDISKIKYIAIHHSGGTITNPFAYTQNETAQDINNAHKLRWPDFPSKLNGSYIGYNFVIDKQGIITQARYILEETAANIEHNLDTVSICLTGNFSPGVEMPTEPQISALKILLKQCLGATNVSWLNIVPHRALWATQCHGLALPDDWARNLVKNEPEAKASILKQLISIYSKYLQLLRVTKLGSVLEDGHNRG